MYRTIGEGWPPLPALAGPRIHQIAELEYVIAPSTPMESKITENRSAIPLFAIIFAPKVRNNGSQFLYFQKCDGNRDNSGIRFLYLRQ
jgi:hypothetical protein